MKILTTKATLAGFVFQNKRVPSKPWIMAVFGFFAVILWIGPLLDCSHLFLMMPEINLASVTASLASGFPVNLNCFSYAFVRKAVT